MSHPALVPDRTAVITGGASGIGLATAERLLDLGMNVCLADCDEAALAAAKTRLAERSDRGADAVLAVVTDVARLDSIERLRDAALARFGELALVMNNAGTGGGGGAWRGYDAWQRVLSVNLLGVVHGLQVFTPVLIEQGLPAAIVNTGSKQGITNPPGDAAYNASKAAVKSLTESLGHELRSLPDCRVTAHLLVPGFTWTGMMQRFLPERPPGAWLPAQVADHLLESIGRGDFYVLCPDNEVTPEIDRRRIEWAAGDLTQNRPALSRWHPDWKDAYEAFMRAGAE
ncbi:MAG: SDR family NAD(P)-dependent oxidoreductase [Myxococcales bacterium]|nr:SDR family NAD(P)-dependent oxidoreductase [Myxococcales bacterium]